MKQYNPLVTRLLLSIVMMIISSCAEKDRIVQAPRSDEELLRVPYISTLDNEERFYFLYLPKGYHDEIEKKWPVIFFLHGNGERGDARDELDYVLIHGPLYEAWVQKRDLPFIIISPQLPMFGRDTVGIPYLTNRNPDIIPRRLESGTPVRPPRGKASDRMVGAEEVDSLPYIGPPYGWEKTEDDLVNMIKQVLEDYNADPDRVYLSGLSYGGFGTWYMASKHPDLFAAINPIVGWGHPDLMEPIAKSNLPVWVFSGGRDFVVKKKYFLPGLNKLQELGHTNLLYTIHEDMGHGVWTRVYTGNDVYEWFLSHSRE